MERNSFKDTASRWDTWGLNQSCLALEPELSLVVSKSQLCLTQQKRPLFKGEWAARRTLGNAEK